jgi:hypothetical protein
MLVISRETRVEMVEDGVLGGKEGIEFGSEE